jgi:protein-S-isoprenylcysteine O-methyltransferase Ste14
MSITRSLLKLSIGSLLFVGLPLVGWGLDDVHGFMRHPARLTYVIVVVFLQLLVVTLVPEAGSVRSGETIGRSERLMLLPLQLIPLAIVIIAPYSDRNAFGVLAAPDTVRYAGVILFSIGFAGMHWAEASLGRDFSVYVTTRDGHRLVTSGPYRHLRHPRYLGIVMFTLGIALTFDSWMAMIFVAAMIVVLVWRVGREEALMHQTFGAEWEEYSRKSWRLVPFIY